MKLITLNTLAGKLRDPLSQFLLKNKDIDIFCFQEIFHNLDETTRTTDFIFEEGGNEKLFDEIQSILTNHIGYFCPIHGEFYGLATFVKKDIEVLETGEVCLHENKAYTAEDESDHGRKLQWLKIKDKREVLIMNMHGHWTGTGKGDTLIRIKQSERIVAFLKKNRAIPKILSGDFNLRPDTESVHMIENEMVNLIAKHHITSTRTSHYKKSERFADYIFLSDNVKEINFKVLPDEVSDHSPLFVEFE